MERRAAFPAPMKESKDERYLLQAEVERHVAKFPQRDRALVLVGAYAGAALGGGPASHQQNVLVPDLDVSYEEAVDHLNDDRSDDSKEEDYEVTPVRSPATFG